MTEDVAVLFNEERRNDGVATVTFSWLLNALDGLMFRIITISTTNRIENLDPSLSTDFKLLGILETALHLKPSSPLLKC